MGLIAINTLLGILNMLMYSKYRRLQNLLVQPLLWITVGMQIAKLVLRGVITSLFYLLS